MIYVKLTNNQENILNFLSIVNTLKSNFINNNSLNYNRDIEFLHLGDKNVEELKNDLKKFLDTNPSFFTQYIKKEDLINIKNYLYEKGSELFNGNAGSTYGKLYQSNTINKDYKYYQTMNDYVDKLLFNNLDLQSINPASVLLKINTPDMDEVVTIIKEYFVKQNKNEDIFDNLLINNNGNKVSSVEICNLFSKRSGDLSNIQYDMINNFSSESLTYLLEYIGDKYKNNKSYLDRENIVINRRVLFNIKKINKPFKEYIKGCVNEKDNNLSYYKNNVDTLSFVELNAFFILYEKDANGLSEFFSKDILSPSLFSCCFLYNTFNEEIKKYEVTKPEKLKKNIDTFYKNLFMNIKNFYGEEVFSNFIKELSDFSAENYKDVIFFKVIPKDKVNKLMFTSLLKNERYNTVQFLLENNYEPSVFEKEYILSKRNFKGMLSKDQAKTWSADLENRSVEADLKNCITGSTKKEFEKFSSLIAENKDEVLYLLNKNKELDSVVDYYYDQSNISKNILNNKSLLMIMILSGNQSALSLVLKENIPLTEKEVALLYIPLLKLKTINGIDISENIKIFTDYLKNNKEISTKDLLINMFLENDYKSEKLWFSKESADLMVYLLTENVNKLSEREKIKIGNTFNGVMSIFVLNAFDSEKDRTLYINLSGYFSMKKFLENSFNYMPKYENPFAKEVFSNMYAIIKKEINMDSMKESGYLIWLENNISKNKCVEGLSFIKSSMEKESLLNTMSKEEFKITKKARL